MLFTPQILFLCFVIINSVLFFYLLCVWILRYMLLLRQPSAILPICLLGLSAIVFFSSLSFCEWLNDFWSQVGKDEVIASSVPVLLFSGWRRKSALLQGKRAKSVHHIVHVYSTLLPLSVNAIFSRKSVGYAGPH